MTREHRLKEIAFGNRESLLRQIPDFDFYRFSRVTRIKIEWPSCSTGEELVLLLTGEYKTEKSDIMEVTFKFGGVRQLRLPEITDRGLWLSELELEEMTNHQMEGIAFKLNDYGSDEFTVLCRTVEFVAVGQSS